MHQSYFFFVCFYNIGVCYLKHKSRNVDNVSNVTLFNFASPNLRDLEYESGKNNFLYTGC